MAYVISDDCITSVR